MPETTKMNKQTTITAQRSMRLQTILGLDIGGTKTAVVEGTREADILQREELATEAQRPFDETFPRLLETTRRVMRTAAEAGRDIAALSVSIGGPLRIGAGELIDPPHLPGWHGVALKARLQSEFPDLPVFIEHDGNAGALAEFHFGAGRDRHGLKHLIFLTFGTGLGAGLIVNGQILHGATDTAGEVGHLRLSWDGPVGFGKAGSWEGFASGQGLVELAAQMFPRRWSQDTAIREVVDAMLADDADALHVAAEAGTWMGRGMALLVDTLNPQMIVLGSLAVALGERVLAPARQALAEEALTQAAAACEIVPAKLGKRIGDVAALM
ncbi:MAG TPA: ROK family protein, partial [Blastocatellia bacterium]|nr:ROK family protein [Blastocatellia bacterium]